jgi:hypothetical protein
MFAPPKIAWAVSVAILLNFVDPQPALSQSKSREQLVEEARSGNRASLSAIHSAKAKVLLKANAPRRGETVWRASYARSLVATKVTHLDAQGRDILSVVYRDGIQRALGGIGGTPLATAKEFAGTIANENEILTDMDVWSLALFYIPHERATLDEMLGREGTTILRAHEAIESGLRKIWIEFETADHWRYKVRIDPRCNYLIDRVEAVTQVRERDRSVEVRHQFEVVSFKEMLPTIYFPEAVTSKAFRKDRLEVEQTKDFSEVGLNEGIPADSFSLRFPTGTQVTDRIRGIVYRAGPDGAPANTPAPYSPSLRENAESREPSDISSDEPWSIGRILMIASAIAIVVGLSMAIRARIKNSRLKMDD